MSAVRSESLDHACFESSAHWRCFVYHLAVVSSGAQLLAVDCAWSGAPRAASAMRAPTVIPLGTKPSTGRMRIPRLTARNDNPTGRADNPTARADHATARADNATARNDMQ